MQIRRNAILPRLFVMLPLVLLIVVPFAANQEIKNLKFCVVDNDHSSFSRLLVQKIDASAYFSLADYCGSHSAAMRSIDGGCADVAVEIGHDFEQNLVKTGVADINVEANAVNGMKGMLAQAYMLQIIADYAAQLGEEHGIDASGVSLAGADVRPRFLYNGQLDYKMFMIPAVMAMLLTLLIGFLPALNIVGEKESGTIEQINVTPVGLLQTDTLLAHRSVHACVVGVSCVAHLRNAPGRQHPVAVSLCHIVSAHRVESWTHCVQLFFHHAAGGPAYVLFPRDIHPYERHAYAGVCHARVGAAHHLCQSAALFHRGVAGALS